MMDGELYPQYSEFADIYGPLKLKVIGGSSLASGYSDFLDSVYFKGPFFDYIGSNVKAVALFNSTTEDSKIYSPEIIKSYNFSLNIDSINRAWGTPAIVSGEYNKGKIILSSVHPEILAVSQRFFINSIYFALTGEKETITSYPYAEIENPVISENNSNLFDEVAFDDAIAIIGKLNNNSKCLINDFMTNSATNYQLVGVINANLNIFIQDIDVRSAIVLDGLEKIRESYGVLENIRKNITEASLPFQVRISLFNEVLGLQNKCVKVISSINALKDPNFIMNSIDRQLLDQTIMIEEITSSVNSTMKNGLIIKLYNSEIATLSELKNGVFSSLALFSLEISSLLLRLDLFEFVASYTLAQ